MSFFTYSQRQRFSLIPLGLSSRRRRRGPRQHAVLRVSDLTSWQDWAQRLCRSARTTLLKQLPKHAEAAVVVTTHTEPHRQLSLEHFLVLYAHQRRVAPNAVVALLASIIRLFVAASMCGAIDELRDARTGALLAWLHVIAKGNTLRLMWWYSADPKG